MKSALQSFDVSYLLHATEDMDRVNSVVSGLVGTKTPPEVEEMTGHFGNGIRKVSFHMHGEDATESFARLTRRMPSALKAGLVNELDLFLDEHASLFLRLDKQRLIEGELAMGSKDAIRLKVKPRAFVVRGRARDFFTSLLEAG